MDLKHIRVSLRRFDPPQTAAVLLDTPQQDQADRLRALLSHPAAWRDLGSLQDKLTDSLDRRPQELLLNVANPIVQRLADSGDRCDDASQLARRGIYFSALLQSKGRLSQTNSGAIYGCLQEALRQTLDLTAQLADARQQAGALRKLVQDRNNALSSAEWIAAATALHRRTPAEFRTQVTNASDEDLAQLLSEMLTMGLAKSRSDHQKAT
jgi:hypothetical protein